MWGRDKFKSWMHVEYEMMNLNSSSRHIARLYDVYESSKHMVLVMELYPLCLTELVDLVADFVI